MDTIQNILPDVIKKLSVATPGRQRTIQDAWNNVAPAKAAGHTAVAGLHNGTLIIHVDASAWLFQMNMHKRSLLAKMQQAVPELTALTFKIGKVR